MNFETEKFGQVLDLSQASGHSLQSHVNDSEFIPDNE